MRRTCPDARAARNASVILVVAGLMSFATNVFGSEVKLIANPALNVDAISVNEVKGVFLGEKNSLKNGTHVQPVLQKRGAVHVAFLEEYLDESDEQLQLYYRTVVFTGKGAMPKTVGSDAEVVAYVARTRGAIGYVDADAHVRGVKTLSIMRAPKGSERALINRIEPHYPPTLLERAIGGLVRLQVTISAQGDIASVSLLGGNPILAQAATEAVTQWKYGVGRSSTTMEISIPFDPQR